ncbi:putative ABC transporter ATP-binding protein [Austwickia sp. TVS 96-490-7B]|uniref:ABC transporter ATP-binding protein n=1 Tax=Austwickia sp. TVS 96-490-7B TaxID=2830843 RepID=UPI001D2E63DF|nr:ABC transporter ATP-binding protein [Austwickia sp. TVS 96-490-7B]MBW3084542.1 putative ABC transporter ATP-binding protein [Austwickia sp. TVS 96-490-7B]
MTIRLTSISKSFESGPARRQVINNVDLGINNGELIALMGPSGSGKSTLLKICAGLELPDQGEVVVNSQRMHVLSSRRRALARLHHIGVIFQHGNLLEELTAAENVALPLRAQGRSRAQSMALASDSLNELGLGDFLDRKPQSMSGGEQQRIGIARALAGHKQILLADEPTGALDKTATVDVITTLRDIADRGAAVVIATHDLLVQDWADRILIIDDGSLYETASMSRHT